MKIEISDKEILELWNDIISCCAAGDPGRYPDFAIILIGKILESITKSTPENKENG